LLSGPPPLSSIVAISVYEDANLVSYES
jgi:hypothetical protein